MRGIVYRLPWFVVLVALLAHTGFGLAQTKKSGDPRESRARPIPSASPLNPRDAARKIELAWMEDRVTFLYSLSARFNGKHLELRGLVPSDLIKKHALRLARQQSSLPVRDRIVVHSRMAHRKPSSVPVDRLKFKARELLNKSMGKRARAVHIQAKANGNMILKGKVKTLKDKVAVSRTLRLLPGCKKVSNQLVTEADQQKMETPPARISPVVKIPGTSSPAGPTRKITTPRPAIASVKRPAPPKVLAKSKPPQVVSAPAQPKPTPPKKLRTHQQPARKTVVSAPEPMPHLSAKTPSSHRLPRIIEPNRVAGKPSDNGKGTGGPSSPPPRSGQPFLTEPKISKSRSTVGMPRITHKTDSQPGMPRITSKPSRTGVSTPRFMGNKSRTGTRTASSSPLVVPPPPRGSSASQPKVVNRKTPSTTRTAVARAPSGTGEPGRSLAPPRQRSGMLPPPPLHSSLRSVPDKPTLTPVKTANNKVPGTANLKSAIAKHNTKASPDSQGDGVYVTTGIVFFEEEEEPRRRRSGPTSPAGTLASQHLQQRLRAVCGRWARDVQVKVGHDQKVEVTVVVPSLKAQKQVVPMIMRLKEMQSPRVHLRVHREP